MLSRLVDQGNTVLVIEHNLDVIKTADWIIDLGPEGGSGGGTVVATGTPEEVAAEAASWTGQFLAPLLGDGARVAGRARREPRGRRSASARGGPARGRELEALEPEPGRHRAPHEGPGPGRLGRLPGTVGDDALGPWPAARSGPSIDLASAAAVAVLHRQPQRVAGVEVPDLGGVHAVPVRALAGGEQVVDGGAAGPAAVARIVAPGLGVPPALGMGLQPESGDDVVGGGRVGHRTSVAEPPSGPARPWTATVPFQARWPIGYPTR